MPEVGAAKKRCDPTRLPHNYRALLYQWTFTGLKVDWRKHKFCTSVNLVAHLHINIKKRKRLIIEKFPFSLSNPLFCGPS
jgi:hypothetical protein